MRSRRRFDKAVPGYRPRPIRGLIDAAKPPFFVAPHLRGSLVAVGRKPPRAREEAGR
jgi:hypothetical protein